MSFLDLTSLFDCRASLRASRTFGAAAFLMFILDKSTLRDRTTSLESASVGVMAEQPGSGPEYQMFIHGRYD